MTSAVGSVVAAAAQSVAKGAFRKALLQNLFLYKHKYLQELSFSLLKYSIPAYVRPTCAHRNYSIYNRSNWFLCRSM
jgi:hypothetical protein